MQQSFDYNVVIGSRDLRRVYLITYSQADVNKFPTRQSFANAVLAAFAATNNECAHGNKDISKTLR